MDAQEAKVSAHNLWENQTFQSLLRWMDELVQTKMEKGLDLPKGEDRDKELDEAAAFKKLKGLMVNKVRNSLKGE